MEVKPNAPICIPSRDVRKDTKETSAVVGFVPVQDLINIVRVNSPWFLTFGIACCAIEMMAPSMARFDVMRFGMIPGVLPANPTS